MSTLVENARALFGSLEDESGTTAGAGAAPLVKLGPGGDFTKTIDDEYAETRTMGIRRAELALEDQWGPDNNEAMLTDALADLLHWADKWGVDFQECLRVASEHHKVEKAR